MRSCFVSPLDFGRSLYFEGNSSTVVFLAKKICAAQQQLFYTRLLKTYLYVHIFLYTVHPYRYVNVQAQIKISHPTCIFTVKKNKYVYASIPQLAANEFIYLTVRLINFIN